MPFWTPATIWKDETVVIVGGGRSLLNFDWSVIKKYKVLVCNKAFLKIPQEITDAVIMCDREALISTYDELQEFPGIVFLNLPEQKKWTERTCPSWAYNVARHYGGGLSDSGLCWNGHTGAAAINLALLCGAKKIYLLGFDMKATDQKNPDWYRQDDSWDKGNPATDERFNNWLETFFRIDRDRKLLFPQAEIINVNDDSALDTFRKMGVKEFVGLPDAPCVIGVKKQVDPNKPSVWIQSPYAGFGDNAWARPFLRIMSKEKNIFIHTAAPEMFWDLPHVFPVQATGAIGGGRIRVQARNISATREAYHTMPANATMIGWPRYLTGSHINKSIWAAFRTVIPEYTGSVDVSFFPRVEWIRDAEDVCRSVGREEHHRLVIVKPPTFRTEFTAPAREPKTKHMQLAIDMIREHSKDAFIIFTGDTKEGYEKFVTPELVGASAMFIKGDIPFSTLLGLMSMAEINLAGQGMFMPIGLAFGVPTFTFFGGAYAPWAVADPQMNLSKWGHVAPDPFCDCRDFNHASCNKEISEETVKSTFNSFLKKHWR